MSSRFSWTPSQRRALVLFLLLAGTGLGIEAWRNPIFYPDPPPAGNASAARSSDEDLNDRIDPNTASEAELSSIPQLGAAHAAAIVAYRESFTAAHPGARAYTRMEDLMKIRGIGRTTAEKLAAHMVFDEN